MERGCDLIRRLGGESAKRMLRDIGHGMGIAGAYGVTFLRGRLGD
jgi:hypothetical protein